MGFTSAKQHIMTFVLKEGQGLYFLTHSHENHFFLRFFFSHWLLPPRNHSIYCEWQVREWQRRINGCTFDSHSVPLNLSSSPPRGQIKEIKASLSLSDIPTKWNKAMHVLKKFFIPLNAGNMSNNLRDRRVRLFFFFLQNWENSFLFWGALPVFLV